MDQFEGNEAKTNRKPNGKKEGQSRGKTEGKSYLQWNLKMECALADILREERGLGHKGDNGWKAVAYNTAAEILSKQFDMQVSADNVKNRVRSWKKFYGIVSDILGQSGFSWDSSTQMISVDENSVWDEYVKSHDEAASFRFKRIPNWDDIVDLCGKDRATGEGVETGFEATEVMTPPEDNHSGLESDVQSLDDIHIIEDISPKQASSQKKKIEAAGSSDAPPPKKRLTTKEVLGNSVARVASSIEELIRATTKNLAPKEVWTEIMAIPNLSREEQIKACAWFIENDKQFLMLKEVPLEMKKDMVLMFIAGGSA